MSAAVESGSSGAFSLVLSFATLLFVALHLFSHTTLPELFGMPVEQCSTRLSRPCAGHYGRYVHRSADRRVAVANIFGNFILYECYKHDFHFHNTFVDISFAKAVSSVRTNRSQNLHLSPCIRVSAVPWVSKARELYSAQLCDRGG